MQHVKMLASVMDVARRAPDRWYVTTGHTAVGPVNLDLLARGVEAGKVPLEAFVRHEEWKVWRPLSELAVVDGVAERGERASTPVPSPTDDISEVDRVSAPGGLGAGAPIETGGFVFVGDVFGDSAEGRREALMLLMTAAVARGTADAAIVHEIDEDGAVSVCAHGPSRREGLGLRTPRRDPAIVAAEAGETLVVTADPGPVGASIVARLGRLAGPCEGALLLPIRENDRLVGMLEIGRRAPFTGAEITSLEALVEALAHKLEA